MLWPSDKLTAAMLNSYCDAAGIKVSLNLNRFSIEFVLFNYELVTLISNTGEITHYN
jgi:hypothetical protein